MKKVKLCIMFAVLSLFLLSPTAYAEEIESNEIYNYQLKESNADKIIENLPDESKSYLNDLGIDGISLEQINSIEFSGIMETITKMISDTMKSNKIPFAAVVGIIIISALVNGFKVNTLSKNMSETTDTIISLTIVSIFVTPIISLISEAADILAASSSFNTLYAPVMAGLLISGGHSVSGASYYSLMMLLCQCINQFSSRFMIPILSIFLGLSIVSSISKVVNIKGICNIFQSSVKWILGFIMSIFVSFMTIKGLIGSSADTAANRAARFALRSFVPIVGNALSDAYLSVQGCLKLLKSGVGIVAIISTAIIFLPILFKCLLWLLTVNICSFLSELFSLTNPKILIDGTGKVINLLIAIVCSCMLMFIISTAIILIIGGS